MLKSSIRFFLYNPSIVWGLLLLVVLGGVAVSPLRLGVPGQAPIPMDALPDVSENQQILRTHWPGQAPQRIEEQINYPLSAALLGVPGVRSVRGQAMFGVSFLYVIFDDKVPFYEARTRLLEQISALAADLLPQGLKPELGPPATVLGQVYMYVLMGKDSLGRVTGGWDLEELRRIQDFELKQHLLAVPGVAEVASIGGYERAFEVTIDPLRLKAQGVSVLEVAQALRNSDIEAGAQTLEMNQVEYVLQIKARIQSLEQLEELLIHNKGVTPVRVRDVATVQALTLPRRALLDYEGAEAVGGILTLEYGASATSVLAAIHHKVAEITPMLPQKRLSDGRISQLHILPYYDRSSLIDETIGTLSHALVLELLITVLVILWMLRSLRGALLVAGLLPFSILMAFLLTYVMGTALHVVSIMGMAIAIGTVVDMGILLWDNVERHLAAAPTETHKRALVLSATLELSPALLTATGSTLLGFLPVFALEASEGRLFHPLAWTKSFMLLSSFLLTLFALPAVFTFFLERKTWTLGRKWNHYLCIGLLLLGAAVWKGWPWGGSLLVCVGAAETLRSLKIYFLQPSAAVWTRRGALACYVGWVFFVFSQRWLPLGMEGGVWGNVLGVGLCVGGLLGLLWGFMRGYRWLFYYSWRNRAGVLAALILLMALGLLGWQGTESLLGERGRAFSRYFPGLRRSFMPHFEEGSFLLMPLGAVQGGFEAQKKAIQQLDKAVAAIPELSQVVGKLGRAETALDPAPMHMFEIVINYKSEYVQDAQGRPQRFSVDPQGKFLRDSKGALIPSARGMFYRNWRPFIRSPEDIWKEIARHQLPQLSRASMLQPIETRRLMLQTGFRAPLGLKIRGQNLNEITTFAQAAAPFLKEVQGIEKGSVYVEPLLGKAYLELHMRAAAAQRLGISPQILAHYIEHAIGGKALQQLQQGRRRWPLHLRYGTELRDSPEALQKLPIRTPAGAYVPLGEVVEIKYVSGPQMIRSENSWPVQYVLFNKEKGTSAPELIARAEKKLQKAEKSGQLQRPPGIHYYFDGTYKETLRAERRFLWIIPLTLCLIFCLLYLQFKSISLSAAVFSSLLLSFAGAFLCLWLYQHFSGTAPMLLRQILGIGREVSLNTAVWVGFIALFGIATDNSVVLLCRLEQIFKQRPPQGQAAKRALLYEAGAARLRPCLMTVATTLLALLPLLAATGKGGALMRAMALPIFGGMLLAPLSLLLLPILYGLLPHSKKIRP